MTGKTFQIEASIYNVITESLREFENTIIPSTFVPFSDNNGEAVYKFGSLDTIFKNSSAGQFENQSNLGL